MPYSKASELPDAVKALPAAGQRLYMTVFNSAFKQYETESQAHAVAWAQVKKKYKQGEGGKWQERAEESSESWGGRTASQVEDALRAKLCPPSAPERYDGGWVRELYEDYCVFTKGDGVEQRTYRADYAFDAEGNLTTSEPAEVRQVWVPMEQTVHETAPDQEDKAERQQEVEPTPSLKPYEKREHVVEWFPAGNIAAGENGDHRIEFLCHGLTEDGSRYYSKRTLEAAVAAQAYDGRMMFLNHSTPAADKARGHRDLRDWGATILPGTVAVNADGNLEAMCHAHTQEARAILDDPVASRAVGLSHDAYIRTAEATINGKAVRAVEAIEQVLSVDFVPAGNTRGRVLEATPITEEVLDMDVKDITVEQLLEARPELVDALAAKVAEKVAETAKDAKPDDKAGTDDKPVAEAKPDPEMAQVKEELAQTRQDLQRRDTKEIVQEMVGQAEGLSATSRRRVMERFDGQIIPAAEIKERVTEAIEAEKTYALELLREAGVRTHVSGAGRGAVTEQDTTRAQEAAQSYATEHREWLSKQGLSEAEIEAEMGSK